MSDDIVTTNEYEVIDYAAVLAEAKQKSLQEGLQKASLEDVKKFKRAQIAYARWQAEESGIDFCGVPLYTDRHSQSVITSLVVQAMNDPDYTLQFKTSAGFITLNAAMIRDIADAVRIHVEAQFAKEAGYIAQINAAETKEDVMMIQWE